MAERPSSGTIESHPLQRLEHAMSHHPIVAGVDPLTGEMAPLELGLALSRATGAELLAVSAYYADPIQHARGGASIEAELRHDAARKLERLTDGTGTQTLVVGGPSAAHVLHDVAQERDAGLLVVGSTFRGVVRRLAPGSTSERLLHGATCPVVVAPRGFRSEGWAPGRVGAAFIDRAEGREALAAAAALAHAIGASLRVLGAVEPAPHADPPAPGIPQPPFSVDEELEAAERTMLAALEELPWLVDARVEAVADYAVPALTRLSERVDLLVCGSRSYGPLRAVLLGGVSHQIVREAYCPVLLVPRGTENALEGLLPEHRATAA
jgi:nucleotide-binding universal stress UspA family protein